MVCVKQLQRQKSILPSAAGTLRPCHKVKVPPPPPPFQAFFTLQQPSVFPPAPSQQPCPAQRRAFHGSVPGSQRMLKVALRDTALQATSAAGRLFSQPRQKGVTRLTEPSFANQACHEGCKMPCSEPGAWHCQCVAQRDPRNHREPPDGEAMGSSPHLPGRRLLPGTSYPLPLEKGQLISGVTLPVKHVQGANTVGSEGEIPHHNFCSVQLSSRRNITAVALGTAGQPHGLCFILFTNFH